MHRCYSNVQKKMTSPGHDIKLPGLSRDRMINHLMCLPNPDRQKVRELLRGAHLNEIPSFARATVLAALIYCSDENGNNNLSVKKVHSREIPEPVRGFEAFYDVDYTLIKKGKNNKTNRGDVEEENDSVLQQLRYLFKIMYETGDMREKIRVYLQRSNQYLRTVTVAITDQSTGREYTIIMYDPESMDDTLKVQLQENLSKLFTDIAKYPFILDRIIGYWVICLNILNAIDNRGE